ncbi:MAG: diguanylate cyclase [Sulfuricaulis sp.]|uniref:diguanylate cyclase n=1 Tax=Sulfuricaulis sp. TaxID=2003553 RepID=UPI0025D434A0|nr:diguanylate cyclase [Sulfuricaulis sp.]MCR4346089.1 diguanylate cyclase [Sulfuricaulis sp.]
MKPFFFTSLSLRSRFLLAMGIVFIPLVVVAVGSSIFLGHAANTLNRIVEQPVYKLQTTSRLQNQIRKSYVLVKDHVLTPRYALRTQFESEAQGVEAVVAEMLEKPFFGAQEQSLLANVRREWKDSVVLANVIFSSDASRAALYQLDQRVNQIMFTLDRMYDTYYTEINMLRADINASEKRFLLIISAAVGIGLLIAVVGAVWLARSVLMPLREFEKGVAHFANEDLSYRLTLNNHDEIGHLAMEFNTMAERLLAHRQKLEELSVRDGLTGLYNRRELEKRLQEEVQRARRYRRPLSVMMLDIDHFKNVNDRYGHQAGDEVLITVADLIQLNVRPVDAVCRYGGEELAVILPETEEEGVRIVAERIRATVEDSITTTPQGDMVHVTVSIGLAIFPGHGDTAAALIQAADQALYTAKHEGRNLVRSL